MASGAAALAVQSRHAATWAHVAGSSVSPWSPQLVAALAPLHEPSTRLRLRPRPRWRTELQRGAVHAAASVHGAARGARW